MHAPARQKLATELNEHIILIMVLGVVIAIRDLSAYWMTLLQTIFAS